MISDGILVLNKPQNWTSHDCVAICRRVLRLKGIKKIGHGGTLDPMAEGVLPIFIGQATRIMEYLELDYKKYKGQKYQAEILSDRFLSIEPEDQGFDIRWVMSEEPLRMTLYED